jgi:tetratricopeptide (TPR) repeat protein
MSAEPHDRVTQILRPLPALRAQPRQIDARRDLMTPASGPVHLRISPGQAFQAAVALEEQGRPGEAERLYQYALALSPDDVASLLRLSTIRVQHADLAGALQLLQRAAHISPQSADAQAALGRLLAALNATEEAIVCYRKALAIKPDNAAVHHHLANALRTLGQNQGAIDHYQCALALAPNLAEAHNNLARLLAAHNRPEEAIIHYEHALAIKPDDVQAHQNLGMVLQATSRVEEALAHYEQALTIEPNLAEIRVKMGDILHALNRSQEAITHYHKALTTQPDDPKAHNNLGICLAALDRHDEAAVHYRKALAVTPNAADVHANLGNALRALGRSQDAIEHYQRALDLSPENAAAHNNLGNALSSLDRHEEAIGHYKCALAIDPTLPETHNNLGTLLASHNRFEEAMVHYKRALAIRPDLAEAHGNLGNALFALNRPDEALTRYEAALAIKPEVARLHHALGISLQVLGRLEEAGRAFERAVALAPGKADFYLPLAHSRPFAAQDPRLAAMEELARDVACRSEEEQIALHFALGKAYADLKQHQRAFSHLRAGNALKRRRVSYDESHTLGVFDRIRATFSPALMRAKSRAGHPSQLPIFIVGMPRSGTTLIEQILASHSKVFGAGEREELSAALPDLKTTRSAAVFPEVVSELSGQALHAFGSRYLERITALAPTAERIVDKMPSNFGLLGLIHLALPHARIIHARRDPVDTCVSCFSILFVGHQPYTYDLGELGRYYRTYSRLMEHWRAALPPGLVLEVQYEDVVADLEGQARRIVAHCGLPWEEACLGFHRSQRPVQTASSVQVRQPLYASSVGRWRHYADELEPLLQELGVSPADAAPSRPA